VKDLWMRYREDLPAVLQGIDLRIAPGERLAVVGKTGSGKTSFVQALFRLYPIERGRIRVAGREAEVRTGPARPSAGSGSGAQGADPAFVDLREYRSLLSYITQEATLFLGTLRENLSAPSSDPLAGRDERSDAPLVQALKRVQFLSPGASDEKYRHWLDYPVEERGRNLSAGERQLVCMARCLLQDSPVVILDEATSAVDPLSEEILTRATEEFFTGKTQILIAHRLSTIRSCDRVLWLQNGRVHRLGTPGEVLPEFERSELDV
jgi:ABC-type multidrug transport system fused ATPase/permease subunit